MSEIPLASRLSQLATHPAVRACAPWLGVLVLNALFVAPAIGKRIVEAPHLLLQPSGDLLVLLGVVVAAMRWRHGRWLRALAVLAGIVLWIFSWDVLIASTIFQETPPLYDQAYLLRHLGVLTLDLWNWKIGLALLGATLGLGLVIVLGRRLFRTVTKELARRPLAHVLPIAIGMAALLVVGTILDRPDKRRPGWRHQQKPASILWITPTLVDNIEQSIRMYEALQRGIEESPYRDYAETYALTRKPDVHLFLVESYGRLLIADSQVGPGWIEHVDDMQRRLSEAGWHMVSGFSQAPVSGGRSWLAEATLLTGMWVPYEATFQQLVANIDRTPNLVAFLDSQGYETVLLAPKDRPRPGVEMVNRYNWDQQILALDLEYTGPSYGWGIIPDQYSLGYAHDNVWSKIDGPIFTNFHMVSSHAPWQVVPEVVDDWRAIADMALPSEAEEHKQLAPERELWERARHYRRGWTRNAYMGDADALNVEAFATAIHYDLEVLTRHLLEQDGDQLVVIMGDHQPPLLSSEDGSYDVPVHVLARDPDMLRMFAEVGFVEGLRLEGLAPTTVSHEGMFSLTVRALVGCCGAGASPPPPYLAEGVRPDTSRHIKP